jgi:hypothetical protein
VYPVAGGYIRVGTGAGAEAVVVTIGAVVATGIVATIGVTKRTVWGTMVGFRPGWVGCVGVGGVGASTCFAVPFPVGLLAVLA